MKEDSKNEDLTKKLPKSDNAEIVLILQNIDSRLHNLEQKVEERLYDTRPIWEKVVADVAQLQEGQRRLEETISSGFSEIKFSVRDIHRRTGVIYETLVALKADYKDMDERVYELELQQRNQSKPQT